MGNTDRVYRIRTIVGDNAPNVVHVPLNQSYDMFEILSLKLSQTNAYKTYESDYGVIVGRVTANGGFGVPNAKISIFIEVSDDDELKDRLLYNFTSTTSTDNNGVRYNVLPDFVDDMCHQDVGTFPNKRLVLDNNDIIEIFDKYWKYTTTTNHAGDYMLFGIPTGSQTLHCDVDLSDCGILSQRPRDMIGKGYNANMFESPNKFKSSTNLNSLAQIITQDRGVYVYPYWGDVSDTDDNLSITRCDISLEYKFESYAVFIGSIVTDKGSNAIGKNCTGTEQNGNMSDLIAGEGTIEMIRKTIDGKVEEYPIMGNRLIDGDGVWCYQIPMNLDYVMTDEFGNLVPTDDPNKGIATRTRVRFRISLDENPNDATARKRARYLVPNNPRLGDEGFDETLKPDYDFGSMTRDESYCDMFWNKVYTVKNYIPKLQKNNKETNRKHTGIKLINHYGDNNPMPYNALTIKLTFTYRLICVIVKVFILLVSFLNNLISILGGIPCWLANIKIWKWKPFKKVMKFVPGCIALSSEFCDDGINPNIYYPGCGKPFECVWTEKTLSNCQKEQAKLPKEDQKICKNSKGELETCIENELAQKNDATSFNFYNDWVNGVLYAPLWYRKIRPKGSFFFGLFKRKAKDEWCSADHEFGSLRIMQTCSVVREEKGDNYQNFEGTKQITPFYHGNKEHTEKCKKDQCNKSISYVKGMYGVIQSKETMLGQTVYYYKPVEYDITLHGNDNLVKDGKPEGEIKLLFATDIVLLGSLNECDLNGIPQFFKNLESTTYNLPSDILFTDHEIENKFDTEGNLIETVYTETSEMAGCDWGNKNEYGKEDGGLFYGIGCSSIRMKEKSCINLIRICEFGVSLDETKQVPDLKQLENKGDAAFTSLVTDGFVSYDELYNFDARSMFATMNGNKLKTKLNKNNGLREYDFRYLYPENFDGSLKKIMEETTKKYNSDVTYKDNYKLEEFSRSYYIFRMGNAPYYYDEETKTFARYENSFYFYFGLKAGKTAIEKFNSKYFAECFNPDTIESQIGVKYEPNSWCSQLDGGSPDGYVAFDFSHLSAPYNLLINGVTYGDFSVEINEITEEYIYISNTQRIDLENKGYKWLKQENDTYKESGTAVPMIKNGAYIGSVVDDDGNITEFNFTIENMYLTFKTEVQGFKQPNNVLGNDYCSNANNNVGLNSNLDVKQVTRDIGGVITVYDIYSNNKRLEEYRIEVRPKKKLRDYLGCSVKNENENTKSGCGVIYYNNQDEMYGFGVGKGGILYDVTVTELCDGVDSDNTVTITLLVEEPIPFKMYINDVDYDLIKNFNKIGDVYTDGWIPNGKIENKMADLQDNRNVPFENNPWFSYKNIWANPSFEDIESIERIDYDELEVGEPIPTTNENNSNWLRIKDTLIFYRWNGTSYECYDEPDENILNLIENKTLKLDNQITLNDLINELTKEHVDGIDYSWCDNYMIEDYTDDYFAIKDGANQPLYNIENVDDIINLINDFIDEANEVIGLRNGLVGLMQNAFFLTCYNQLKSINIVVQTSDMPYRTTLVYQQEESPEDDNQNILTSNNMVTNYEGHIDGINIPTITYACNERYGIAGRLDYEPCVAEYNGYQRHAYYVGTVNDTKQTLPVGLTSNTDSDNINHIDERNNQLAQLFDFPLIDKVLRINYMSWSYFDDIPYYKKYTYTLYQWDEVNGLYVKPVVFLRQDNSSYCGDLIKVKQIQSVCDYKFYKWENDRYVDIQPIEPEDNEIPEERIAANIKIKELVIDIVNGRGSFAGVIINGNTIDNHFEEQTLGGIPLLLSDNIINNDRTYVERRIVLGYENNIIANTLENVLNDIINKPKDANTIGQINNLFNTSFENSDEINDALSTFVVDDGYIRQEEYVKYNDKYYYWDNTEIPYYEEADIVSHSEIPTDHEEDFIEVGGVYYRFVNSDYIEIEFATKSFMFGMKADNFIDMASTFEIYILEEGLTIVDLDKTQYAPLLPMDARLFIDDDSLCEETENTIYGGMTIKLTENAVNDCRTNAKILEVIAENSGDETKVYSVITINDELEQQYPLNYAEENLFSKAIPEEIYGSFVTPYYEYNIFSYKMVSDYFRKGNTSFGISPIVDTQFKSKFAVTREDGSVVYEETNGYGTTGHFDSVHSFMNFEVPTDIKLPVYIVAETENHCRAISPVYDYSYVEGVLKYGKYHRKDTVIDCGSDTVPDAEEIDGYRLGAAITSDHYYLDNYPYKLTCDFIFQQIRYRISEETFSIPKQYIFYAIDETLFNLIKSLTKTENNRKEYLKQHKEDIIITATDYVGLRHICGLGDLCLKETEWFTFIWHGNLPLFDEQEPSYETCGIEMGNNVYVENVEFAYEKDEEGIDIPSMWWFKDDPEVFPYVFKGWSKDEPITCMDENGSIALRDGKSWDDIIVDEFGRPKTGFPGKVDDCWVFFGNWWIECEPFHVTFIDMHDVQIGDTVEVQCGDCVEAPADYQQSTWYLVDENHEPIDPNKPEVDLCSITRDAIVKEHAKIDVDWTKKMFKVHFLDENKEELSES